MSGPITAGYAFAHLSLLLAQRALQEARAMKREYSDVLAQLRAREEELAAARDAQQAARLERIATVRRDAARREARLARLRALGDTLSAQLPDLARKLPASAPAAPAGDDDAAWRAHLLTLDHAVRELEALLEEAGSTLGAAAQATLVATTNAPTLDDVLAAYVLQRQLAPGLDSATAETLRQTTARVLGRLELADDATLPTEIEALARTIVLAPSLDRAEALTTELRLAVQRHREARTAQQADAAEARRLLAELPDDAPAPLQQALERVAAGAAPIDAALRRATEAALATAAADRAQQEQAAAAFVLEESLRDLGYEVDGIEATLFANGGTVHFRRAGWESYMVRLRVDARERTVNFNVVRARGAEENAERRRDDALAEDRWCAEFPRLMQTLASRGLALDVTRRLAAGEIPVQVVDPASLPAVRADDDTADAAPKPLARRTP
jgi:DNA repair exonuclease SbcCD ATPase subunit